MSALLALCAFPLLAPPAPQQCLWDEVAPAPLERLEAQSVVLDDRLYLFGGFHSNSLKATPRADVYDPATDTWTRLADMPEALTHHTAALDGTTVWVVGGFRGDHPGRPVPSVFVYDVPTDTWSAGPFLPADRAGGALVRVGRRLHFYGGFSDRVNAAAQHWVLELDDVAAGWNTSGFAPLRVARGHLGGILLNGQLYAIGGQDSHDGLPADLAVVSRYDAAANDWVRVADLPTPRSHIEASTWVQDGRIVIAGGRDNQSGGGEHVIETTAYDPVKDAWAELPPLPLALVGASAKPIGDRLYVTTGGSPNSLAEPMNFVRDLAPVLPPLTRVNAGGPYLAVSERWCPDAYFVGGEASRVGGSPAIADTDDDALYWTEHTGTFEVPEAFSYRFPVEDGDYRVRLFLAEVVWTAPGQRVFDVVLEDLLILDDHDIVADVGPLTAKVHTFDVDIEDGSLDLEFLASVDRPKVSAIEVSRLPDGFFDTYCQGALNSTGLGASLDFIGSVSQREGNLRLVAENLPRNQLAAFFVSGAQDAVPFGNGLMCLSGTILSGPILSTGPGGTLDQVVPARLFPVGVAWNFQVGYLDAPFGFNYTDALQLRFTP